ncbi:DUF5802 family protein [Halorussus aquaticus]|uniref:DUF5802 family protein n=1 Tax=Halorussus aquaticus TaxID=2953748 RepID=A0ABD5Q606_9EURY|nr:DUF5802 family protein [Halorussus aquaticus]
MFEEFSSGYYLGRLYVQPSDREEAVMRRDEHERINEQLYTSGEGIERLDSPLVMKVDQRHVAVHGDEGIPEGTLALPERLLEDTRVRNPPTLKEVLLAKADRADQLLRYQETTTGVGT